MTKGRAGRLPRACKGRKIYDDIDGSMHFERDRDMMKQRGMNVHKSNYDKVLDSERTKTN